MCCGPRVVYVAVLFRGGFRAHRKFQFGAALRLQLAQLAAQGKWQVTVGEGSHTAGTVQYIWSARTVPAAAVGGSQQQSAMQRNSVKEPHNAAKAKPERRNVTSEPTSGRPCPRGFRASWCACGWVGVRVAAAAAGGRGCSPGLSAVAAWRGAAEMDVPGLSAKMSSAPFLLGSIGAISAAAWEQHSKRYPAHTTSAAALRQAMPAGRTG